MQFLAFKYKILMGMVLDQKHPYAFHSSSLLITITTTNQLVYKVIVLVLTPSVSIVTTKQTISASNTIKPKLYNKKKAYFLNDTLILYIEWEITTNTDSIVDDFRNLIKPISINNWFLMYRET